MFDFIRKSFGNKIMTAVILSITLAMGLEITLRVYFGTRERIEIMETLSRDMAASTFSGIMYPMSLGDSKAVERVLTDVRTKMEGIEVFICNTALKITWSTHAERVSTKISSAIHSDETIAVLEQTLRSGASPDRSFEIEQYGNRYLVIIQPIRNEADCFHCHGRSKEILGGMVIKTNVEQTLTNVEEARDRTILITLFGVLVTISLIYMLVRKFVGIPVENLSRGVRRVAEGDLDSSIKVLSSDEIGDLARSFNRMTWDLKMARDEINNWALSLEDLVEERTSQLKRAQEGIIQSERMASMGRLAAIVAHEINNPLAGIRTYAKLLLKKSDKIVPCAGAEYVEYLKIIESESARCGEIVRGLLQFTRPSRPMFSEHDLNILIQESSRLVQHKVHLLNVEVRLNLNDEPVLVKCDGQKIKQALVAILINACDAVQQNTGFIEMRSRILPEKNGVEFSVQDNGVGMDENTKAHMFEPFFTTKAKLQPPEADTNTGLGVSVVFEIVKSHHGEISVDTELGKGTTITIFLPADPAEFTPGE